MRYVEVKLSLSSTGTAPYSDSPGMELSLISKSTNGPVGQNMPGTTGPGQCATDLSTSVNIPPGQTVRGCLFFQVPGAGRPADRCRSVSDSGWRPRLSGHMDRALIHEPSPARGVRGPRRGLETAPRAGRPQEIDDAEIARVLAMTLGPCRTGARTGALVDSRRRRRGAVSARGCLGGIAEASS
jgi:hypothetical protein